jgi:hypothetical protein
MGNVTTRKGVIQKPSVVLDNKNWGVGKKASTFHDDSMKDETTRRGVIQKTSVVLNYIKNTGGVDKNDGQLRSYKLARERLKK